MLGSQEQSCIWGRGKNIKKQKTKNPLCGASFLLFETAAAPLGWAEIGGLQRRLLIRGAAASHPPRSPEFPFCTRWAFCLVGAFLFFHLLAKTEMSGLGPVPCTDPLPAALSPVWKQRRGRGQLWRRGSTSLGRQVASPHAQHHSVSKSLLPLGSTLFSSPGRARATNLACFSAKRGIA